jgi:hypothetical protein
MTTRKIVAHSATIVARIAIVNTPRGIRGFWVNVATCRSSGPGEVAVTWMVRDAA